jgi:archaellum biogenesis ATPase FlaH
MAPTMRAKRERKQIKQNQQLEDFIQTTTKKKFEELTYNINHLYPDVNVIDMTTDIYTADNEDKYNNNLKKIKDLSADSNNFVIIFNINTITLSRFFDTLMVQRKVPKRAYENVTDDDDFLLFRKGR